MNFRALYDDLTDEVMRSSEAFLKDHLANWFEHIDETPAVGALIQSLEAGLDFDKFKEEREATIQSMAGSGQLRWPKGREQRVGWVERSDTHQLHFIEMMGFAGSTHPTLYAA